MPHIPAFTLLILLLASCRSAPTLTTSPPPLVSGTPDVIATVSALPSTPSIETSRLVLQSFLESYNRHDLLGVLATLSETFVYGDCDFVGRHMYVWETSADLTAWLNIKFADQDRFLVDEIMIAPAEGSPPNDPRNTAVRVRRVSLSLQGNAHPRQSLLKIILNPDGNRIQYLNTYGNVDCDAGR